MIKEIHLKKDLTLVLTSRPFPCSEYYGGHGGWLDHVFVSNAMTELAVRTANVYGYCEVKSCTDIDSTMPAAYWSLSDHCPVVFVINDQDDDSGGN